MNHEHSGDSPSVFKSIRHAADFSAANSSLRHTLKSTRCRQSVCSRQPPRAQFCSTEITRNHANDVHESCAIDLRQDRAPTRSRRLTVVIVPETSVGQSNGPHVVRGVIGSTSLDITNGQTLRDRSALLDGCQKARPAFDVRGCCRPCRKQIRPRRICSRVGCGHGPAAFSR